MNVQPPWIVPSKLEQKTKRHVYKPHDYVEIVNPTFVKRVGYPLTPDMVLTELNNSENRQKIIDFLHDFDIHPYDTGNYVGFTLMQEEVPRPVKKIMESLAYYTVSARNFGGSERKLHHIHLPHLKNEILCIEKKKVVRTGTRVPSCGSADDYEPGYLDNAKSHVLLAVWHGSRLWIEQENVIPHNR